MRSMVQSVIRGDLIVNSELSPPQRQQKLLALLVDEMPFTLKRRMSAGVFVLVTLAANAALAVAANGIVRLLSN
jgi:hypothetical protein